ncbi:hypothetical protein LDO32_09015 [Luteimonas sp. Y-2-2-4F]|nr:hypothetical protein [Luteimonas sp. Y-2-2-4F]MCD9031566.1 hypothetical protein [Luteimonas sp. Y-2-2-4F]MCD9031859.1 hypothetical protein [Luteimonas sp. Y-2-2-4F]
MNEHDDALSARLRALPREMVPPAQAWEAVSRGLDAAATPAPRPWRGRRRLLAGAGMALAATLAGVAVLPRLLSPLPAPEPEPSQLRVQADAMAQQYRVALQSLPAAAPAPEVAPALAELDRSAAEIHAALDESPGSAFLIGQLQRTYAKRLELTRQVARDAAFASS